MWQVVTRAVNSLGFGFYSLEEVLAISVKRVTSPTLFDNLRNPTQDGLYDPALGPIDSRSMYSPPTPFVSQWKILIVRGHVPEKLTAVPPPTLVQL